MYPDATPQSQEDLNFIYKIVQTNPQISSALEMIEISRQSDLMGHSFRVAGHAIKIGKSLGFGFKNLCILAIGAVLHDLGKLQVPLEIITKKAPLNDREYSIIKKHPIIGQRIVKSIVPMTGIDIIVRQHHERMDGRGYPDGFDGDRLRLEARVVSVADSYDAMRSKRCYRDALSEDQAIGELINGQGDRYDQSVVERFLCMLERQKRKVLALLPFRLFRRHSQRCHLLSAMPLQPRAVTVAIAIAVAVVVGAGISPVIKTLDIAFPKEKNGTSVGESQVQVVDERYRPKSKVTEVRDGSNLQGQARDLETIKEGSGSTPPASGVHIVKVEDACETKQNDKNETKGTNSTNTIYAHSNDSASFTNTGQGYNNCSVSSSPECQENNKPQCSCTDTKNGYCSHDGCKEMGKSQCGYTDTKDSFSSNNGCKNMGQSQSGCTGSNMATQYPSGDSTSSVEASNAKCEDSNAAVNCEPKESQNSTPAQTKSCPNSPSKHAH